MSYEEPPANTIRLEAFMYFCGCESHCSTAQPRIYAIVPCDHEPKGPFCSGKIEHRQRIWEGSWLSTEHEDMVEMNAEGREACKHYGIETDEFDDWD